MPAWYEIIRVGKVPYGKGVFAIRTIAAGETIGKVTGKVIEDPEYTSTYCIDLGDGVKSLEPRGPFRYLNHCCEPNAKLFLHETVYEDGTPGPTEVTVEALCTIEPEEEVRIDYAWDIVGAIPCLCGASQCRGWIVDPEQLPKLLKKQKKLTERGKAPQKSK
ncbi:SET domain-containing protein [Planctopirus hydrillae]|uniref:SET domain-containing protein-lysine N-methyltransferase n=1 Tax=Planctopirus hydrillae TaxID=1841610 RepID=A0A1C3E5C4_9PLAN|nr:SET domain-containing protein-lysine N-methyltransferase [Planctopirus hydrillae]ODA28430.1 SET domain-containing protein-lysine N-methyltransferase [Planctopirus hydrillae]